MWRPGVQANAHELLIGILNNASVAAAINDLIQFNMVTTGKCIYMHLIADT